MKPSHVLPFDTSRARKEPVSQPPVLGVVLLYSSLWAVWGLVAWATDISVGAIVALVYAAFVTVYLDHVW